jgi:hypothetical protein
MSGTAASSHAHKEAAHQLRTIAEQLERGQADTPLVDQAESLLSSPDQRLTIVLLGLDPASKAAALSWVIGPQHHTVSVKLTAPLDLLDIRLQERGFSLEAEGQGRQEFDAPEAFASAIDALGLEGDELSVPLCVALAAPLPLRNLQILVIREPDTLLRSPGLLEASASKAPVLMVAASGNHQLSAKERDQIANLSGMVAALWPVVVQAEGTVPGDLQAVLPTLGIPLLPATVLSPEGNFVPDFIVRGATHPVRAALSTVAQAERCMRLLDMIQERFDSDLRQIQARQKREARLERSLDSSAKVIDSKQSLDRAKQRFSEEVTQLLQSVRESGRRSLMKSGDVGKSLDQLLSSLQSGDLNREASSKVVRLSLKPEVLSEFRKRLGKVLRDQVNEECALIRDGLDESRRALETSLAEVGSSSRGIAMIPPDSRSVWEPVAEMLELDIAYKGEIPRRGFLQRLGEGRRVVFVLLMALSLVGSFAGFNIRQAAWAGVIFLILFIGAVAYTYKSWEKEDEESLVKEIERVRESVATEFNRVLNELLREKQSRLQQALDEVKRETSSKLDFLGKEVSSSKASQADAERKESRGKLKLLDQRLKELGGLGQQLNRVRQVVVDAVQKSKSELQRLLNPSGQHRADA